MTKTILLVDDDSDVFFYFEWLCARFFADYQVLHVSRADTVESVLDGLEVIPSVFVLDYYIPGKMDGLSLSLHLKQLERYRGVPIIGISASIRDFEIQELKAAGVVFVAAKPIDTTSFRIALKEVLEGEGTWNYIPSPRKA